MNPRKQQETPNGAPSPFPPVFSQTHSAYLHSRGVDQAVAEISEWLSTNVMRDEPSSGSPAWICTAIFKDGLRSSRTSTASAAGGCAGVPTRSRPRTRPISGAGVRAALSSGW